MRVTYSLQEAAVIADVPERAVRKAIEAKSIHPRLAADARALRYRFNARDLLFLKVLAAFPLDLPRQDKRDLEQIIEGRHKGSGRWVQAGDAAILTAGDVQVRIEIKPLRSALAHRLMTYRRGRRRIVSNTAVLDGEPVFEGTRVPLAHIAGLVARNVPIEDIAEDYPALSPDDLRFAAMVARLKPRPGRPRKPLAFLRNGQSVTTHDRAVVMREAPTR